MCFQTIEPHVWLRRPVGFSSNDHDGRTKDPSKMGTSMWGNRGDDPQTHQIQIMAKRARTIANIQTALRDYHHNLNRRVVKPSLPPTFD
eukprot:scaffold3389_cov119-Cylindrotheca_fusiformis.AAC.8